MSDRGKNRPLRLLFVQTQAEMAGAQEISRLLGAELSRPDGDGIPEFDVHHLFLYRKTAGCDGFPNVHFAAQTSPKGLPGTARFGMNLLSIMRKVKPDVLLPFQHYGNIVAAPLGRLLGVRRIIANHVSAPATISGPVRRIDRLLGLAGFYDAMTVNSQATWRDYQAYPERYRRRIVYVPHGFADKTTTMSADAARVRFGLPVGVRLMGTVARLHPLKRIDLAIRILAQRPDLHLAVAGQGPDEQRLRAFADTAGVTNRLHLVGELAPADIGAFLGSLDVFVFPSAAETFGLAAVEAAQAGIPVVANDMPVMREVLQVDGEPCALFVDPTDSAAFTESVTAILADPALNARLSAFGRQLAKHHSLDTMVDCYRQLILGRAVADRPQPPRADPRPAGIADTPS